MPQSVKCSILCLLAACGAAESSVDDAGGLAANRPAPLDAGKLGVVDAGQPPFDSGVLPDAGRPDAGIRDAGLSVPDDGRPRDAGPRPDAGPPTFDAGDGFGFGWSELPNTKMRSVCSPSMAGDDLYGTNGCAAVMSAWSGGIADLARSRLIVWGGGHNNYYGNEVYAFDLALTRWERLTDPTRPTAPKDQYGPISLGTDANGRHTFDGLVAVPEKDLMYVVGGAPSGGMGGISSDTWTFSLAAMTWSLKSASLSGASNGIIGAADYDPGSKLIFVNYLQGFSSYDSATNTYTRLDNGAPDYHYTGRVDPLAKKFLLVSGAGFWVADISASGDKMLKPLSMTGCSGLQVDFPGLAFHPMLGKLVGWAGGDSVYVIDLAAGSCKVQTFPNGPGPQQDLGTTGRFRYFPSENVMVVANDVDQNVYVLRIQPE